MLLKFCCLIYKLFLKKNCVINYLALFAPTQLSGGATCIILMLDHPQRFRTRAATDATVEASVINFVNINAPARLFGWSLKNYLKMVFLNKTTVFLSKFKKNAYPSLFFWQILRIFIALYIYTHTHTNIWTIRQNNVIYERPDLRKF